MENLNDGVYGLTFQHLQELALILTQSFMMNNPVWSKADLNRNFVIDFFRKEIKINLDSQLKARQYMGHEKTINFIYVKDGKIVGAFMHYEIEQYRQYLKNSKPSQIQLFQVLQKQGKKLTKIINIDELQKGKCIFGTWFVARSDLHPKYKIQLLCRFQIELKRQGIVKFITRSSNIKAVQLFQFCGGKLLSQITFQFKGNSNQIYFVQITFDNPQLASIEHTLKSLQRLEERSKL